MTNNDLYFQPPDENLPVVTLDDLTENMKTAAANAKWPSLTKVQAQTIPYFFANKDIMVQSQTGSGKTGAFLLPLLEKINPLLNECQALILAPTRELANQVAQEAETLVAKSAVRTLAVYGGTKYRPQVKALKAGAHIVVGTPGRVLDHLLRKNLRLDHIHTLLFDEADRLLSMGFFDDMVEVRSYLPDAPRHTGMFSATFPPNVIRLATYFLNKPHLLSLSTDNVHVLTTNHAYYQVPPMDKDRGLVRLIEQENPDAAIIFCNTRTRVDYIATVLRRFGYDAEPISSDLSQNDRERVMGRLRAGELRFLVATDVAARGIDIPELSHVFQYDIPDDHEIYIHRAGRTGRAGASGEAICLVDFKELMRLQKIARQYDIKLEERPMPTDEDTAKLVSQRLTAILETKMRTRDKLRIERMQRFIPLVTELAQDEDGQQLLAMLLDDYYQDSLHNPPTLKKSEPKKDDSKSRRRRRR
ncbi:MAG TPA: DEAD/DEAH box helicase [Anaerolineae bacterium]|nr:DEAD/DEAH box helicase [Anaerolineae bacterium]